MIKPQDFVIDWYPRPDDEVRYCATAHYAETSLTYSVYVLNCDNANSALQKAEDYFNMIASQSMICKTVSQIDILPRNAGRWSNVSPELIRKY